MTLCSMWTCTLACVVMVATGGLATNNTTNLTNVTTAAPTTEVTTITTEVPSRPNLHLPLDPGTIAGIAAGVAVAIILCVTFVVAVSCLGIYQVCSYFDQV